MFTLLLEKDSIITVDLQKRNLKKQTNLKKQQNTKKEQQICQIYIKQSLNTLKQLKRQETLQKRQLLKKKIRQISQGKPIQDKNINLKKKKTYKSLPIFKIVQQLKKICHDIKHTLTLISGVYNNVLLQWGKILKDIQNKTYNYYQTKLQKISQAVSIRINDRYKEEESAPKKLTESQPTFTFEIKQKIKDKFLFTDQIPQTISDIQEQDIKISNIKKQNRSSSDYSKDQKQTVIQTKKTINNQESFQKKDSTMGQKIQDELKNINEMLFRLQKVII